MTDSNTEPNQTKTNPLTQTIDLLPNKLKEETEEDFKPNINDLFQSSSASIMKKERKLFSESYINIQNFEKIAQVGEGTYGKVYKVKRKSLSSLNDKIFSMKNTINHGNSHSSLYKNSYKSDYFALKKLIYDNDKEGFPVTALREIKILQDLDHKNIVKLLDIIVSKPTSINNNKGNVYLLLEYIEHDLSGILDKKIPLTSDGIKGIIYQILQGVDYMHNIKGVLHRDIKASNILITSNGKVKIADFGLARYFSNRDFKLKKPYTNKVITLWYRPPELFFDEVYYKESIDIWSIGILFWQLLLGYPPIRSSSDDEHIERIIETMGSIDEEDWPEVKNYSSYSKVISNKKKGKGKFSEMISGYDNDVQDLLRRMLTYNPRKRILCKEALSHEYFLKDLSFTQKYDSILTNILGSSLGSKGESFDLSNEQHEFLVNKKRQGEKISIVNERIKMSWVNCDYYSKKNKLSEINYYSNMLNK